MNALTRLARWAFSHPAISALAVVAVIVLISPLVSVLSGSKTENESPVIAGPPGTTGPNRPGPDPNELPDLPSRGDGGTVEVPGTDVTIDPGRVKPKPDPFDTDPDYQARIEQQLVEQPAMQFMPLGQGGVFADLTNILPDDRLLITATYSGSEAEARRVWNAFLRQHGDSGRNYVVVFEPR